MEVLLTQNKQLDLEQIKVMSQEDMFFLCSGASTEIQFRFAPLLWSKFLLFFLKLFVIFSIRSFLVMWEVG